MLRNLFITQAKKPRRVIVKDVALLRRIQEPAFSMASNQEVTIRLRMASNSQLAL